MEVQKNAVEDGHRHPKTEHLLLSCITDIITGNIEYKRDAGVHTPDEQLRKANVDSGVHAASPQKGAMQSAGLAAVVSDHVRREQATEEEPLLGIGGDGGESDEKRLCGDQQNKEKPYSSERIEDKICPLRSVTKEVYTGNQRQYAYRNHRDEPLHEVQGVVPVSTRKNQVWHGKRDEEGGAEQPGRNERLAGKRDFRAGAL
jgi:hypothetical protein